MSLFSKSCDDDLFGCLHNIGATERWYTRNHLVPICRHWLIDLGGAEMSVSGTVQNAIKSSKVVIFSKTYCPFCQRAKQLFDKLGQKYSHYELDTMDDGAAIQDHLLQLTGQRTVPNVFINGKHIGGYDKTSELESSGQLQKLLAD